MISNKWVSIVLLFYVYEEFTHCHPISLFSSSIIARRLGRVFIRAGG